MWSNYRWSGPQCCCAPCRGSLAVAWQPRHGLRSGRAAAQLCVRRRHMSRRYILATAAFVLAAAGVWLVPARASTDIEQAVIIHFSYGSTNFKPVFALQERLEKT